MVLNAANGQILNKAVVPDSAETYCSPLVIDLKGDGNLWVLYGTGGESLGGAFYAVPLTDLLNDDISTSILLASHPTRGFVAPPSVHASASHNGYDIIVQGLGGTVYKFSGADFSELWSTHFPGTESSTQPVIGNFTGGDHVPDVFAVLYKGTLTSYSDYYQVMLDGVDGSIQFYDSLGSIHFSSGNAVDLNNDGRDEAIISLNYHDNGYFHHKLQAIDFQNDDIIQLHTNQAGTNLGCTPLIQDLDNNDLLDIVYVVRKDSMNPVGLKGIDVIRYETNAEIPHAGIAWGSYIGTNYDGIYNYTPIDCGAGSVVTNFNVTHTSCNGMEDGAITLNLVDPTEYHTFLWSNGAVDANLTDLNADTYSVRVTNHLGCYQDLTMGLVDPYILTFGGIQTPSCPNANDGVATVNSTGCPCMFNTCVFDWNSGDSIAQATMLTSGYQVVSILHPDGCIVTDSVWIPEAAPIFTDTIVSQITCFGVQDGEIEVVGNSLYTLSYNWSQGDTTSIISNLEKGSYTLMLSDNRPCFDTLHFTINEPDELLINVNGSIESGVNNNDGEAEVEIFGGTQPYSIQWNDDNLQTTSVASDLSNGSYVVEVEDSNGCMALGSIYIHTVSILNYQEESEWTFYPNPADQFVTIKGVEDFHFYILDMYGKVVLTGEEPTINLTVLNSGIYTLRLDGVKGYSQKKLVIVR